MIVRRAENKDIQGILKLLIQANEKFKQVKMVLVEVLSIQLQVKLVEK